MNVQIVFYGGMATRVSREATSPATLSNYTSGHPPCDAITDPTSSTFRSATNSASVGKGVVATAVILSCSTLPLLDSPVVSTKAFVPLVLLSLNTLSHWRCSCARSSRAFIMTTELSRFWEQKARRALSQSFLGSCLSC